MKILMVSVHFNLPEDSIPIGGVQKHISKITDVLMKRSHIVEWVYPGEAKKEAETFKPDIVIFHDFSSFVDGLNTPSIIVYHGWEGQIPPSPQVIKVRQEIGRKCNGIIHIGAFIEKWYRQKPDLVLWGGVDEVPVVDPPREKRLLLLGRLAKDCSPCLFFEALKRYKEVLWEYQCTVDVCGDGPLRVELEEFAKKNELNVTFHGFVNNVDEFIKNSDVVLTSGYLSILESYINKRPVISVRENDLKRDYLSLMPCKPIICRNTHNISNAIDINISQGNTEEDRKILWYYFPEIENNYQFAIQNTWSKVVDRYEELIGRII